MKSMKTLLILIFFSLGFMSCENEQLEEENQQEYFEITNTETGEIISLYNVSARLISSNNSADSDILSVRGLTEIPGDNRCGGIAVFISTEVTGTYNNDEANYILSDPCTYEWTTENGNSSNHDGIILFHFGELNIVEFGEVGDIIRISIDGYYKISDWFPMTAELQVFRDE